MCLFFDLNKLEDQSCNDPTKFLYMLYYYWTKAPLNKENRFVQSKISLAGHSYILNPSDLFYDQQTDELFKVQYIKLAARRDYSLYRQYNYCRLQTSYFPDLKIDSIKSNPLLDIKQTEIIFKYEER